MKLGHRYHLCAACSRPCLGERCKDCVTARRGSGRCEDCGRRCQRRSVRCRKCDQRHRVRKCGVYCGLCLGMPWRVEGIRCACGLVRGPDVQEIVLLKTSPIARCEMLAVDQAVGQ